MGAYILILCLALIVSSYGLKQKKRISNLEKQLNALSWQTKQDMLDLRCMIQSMNNTDNAVFGDNVAQCNPAVKCEDMQTVVKKMEVFMDEQNEKLSVLRRAFKSENKKVKASLKELGDRVDKAEFDRKMANVEIKSELTALFQELKVRLDDLEQTLKPAVVRPASTVQPQGPLEQTGVLSAGNLATTVKPPTPPCPASWAQHGDKCYLYVKNEYKTWKEAIQRCHDYDGILAEPDTEETMLYVGTLVDSHTWLGATDELTEGTWIWEHSKKQVTYFKWNSRQPNNDGGNQNCMEIFVTSLNDDDCGTKQKFVCQKNAIIS